VTIHADPEQIRSTYRRLVHCDHGVSEVRVIQQGKGILGIGFFDNEDAFVEECVRANATANVYVGIQPRPARFLKQAPNIIRSLHSGAGFKDIEVVVGTVIDIDPVRPKDQASTETELQAAIEAANKAADWCESQGFLRPVRMMSGNGAQLWFAVPPIQITDENRDLVQSNMKAFEAALRKQLNDPRVKIDSIYDLPRIIKVIGTVSRKGTPTDERPHRLSRSLDDVERTEDETLRARLVTVQEAQKDRQQVIRPSLNKTEIITTAETKACRAETGDYDWEHPVEMCAPVQRLWNVGCDDRSLAIFDMVRFFMHKGLGLDEITNLITEYDRRGLGKLEGRDAAAYVQSCYDKIISSRKEDSSIPPPCHSLQQLGYCKVNTEAGARCEHYDIVIDIEKRIEEIPEDCPPKDLEQKLKPIIEAISFRAPSVHGRYLELLAKRFKLKTRDLRRALGQTGKARDSHAPDLKGGDDSEDAIEGEIYEDTCFYYTINGRGDTRMVSSFAITPTMRVETEEGEIIFGRAQTDKGTAIDGLKLPLKAFHSKKDLIRHLPSADLQWTGNDNNVQGLMRILARCPVPRRPGTNMLGDYKKGDQHLWVYPGGAIDKTGFVNPSPIVYVQSGGSLDSRIRYTQTDESTFLQVARTMFKYLPKLNTPEVILPIIGWFFATPMKPRLMETAGSFPTLFIWGTQGSGKSSLAIDVFWPLFGVRDAEPYSATETEFALLKILTATRSVPVFIDEYKPYDMQRFRLNTLHRYLRRLYRGEVEERGRPDLSVSTYHLQAPLCVAGETRPIEAALLERIITANPEKTTLDEHPECREALRELKSVDLSLIAPRYIQFCLNRDLQSDLKVARDVTGALVADRKAPIRVVENLTAMVLGIHLFEQFAEYCGYRALPPDLGLAQAVNAILADVVETDHGVKNALDHFIEMLGVMAVQGELRNRTHYIVKDETLYIHLESAYDQFRQHCKRIDYEGEMIDIKALKRLVRENCRQKGYMVAENDRVYFGVNTNRRRAIGLNLSKTQLVTSDDFQMNGNIETDEADLMSRWEGRRE
jgi:hypothetical protein